MSLLALLAALLTSTAFAQEETTCATPRFLLHMSNSENGIADPASLLLNGTPLRVYEGEPFEWSHYAIAVLPCDDDTVPDIATGEDLVAGIFSAADMLVDRFYGLPAQSDANLVPDNCNNPIYLLGINTVTDADQYAIYREALTGSRIAPRHGFVRIFGRTPDLLLAGTWPDNTTATLSIWPCAEAFHKMHTSDEFQNDIKPLRNNAAYYRLMTYTPLKD
jgi:hypothetical protein